MAVSTPGVHEQCFAFATSDSRDSFMWALQAKSDAVTLAALSTSAPNLVAAEAHNAAGGGVLAKVNLPHLAAARLAVNASARNPSIGPRARSKPQIPAHISRSPIPRRPLPALRQHSPLLRLQVKRSRQIQMQATPAVGIRVFRQRPRRFSKSAEALRTPFTTPIHNQVSILPTIRWCHPRYQILEIKYVIQRERFLRCCTCSTNTLHTFTQRSNPQALSPLHLLSQC
jgi:hypothetical protein